MASWLGNSIEICTLALHASPCLKGGVPTTIGGATLIATPLQRIPGSVNVNIRAVLRHRMQNTLNGRFGVATALIIPTEQIELLKVVVIPTVLDGRIGIRQMKRHRHPSSGANSPKCVLKHQVQTRKNMPWQQNEHGRPFQREIRPSALRSCDRRTGSGHPDKSSHSSVSLA